ncbi:MAG: DUF1800 domain-containing protein [Pseudomonadota bacterium]
MSSNYCSSTLRRSIIVLLMIFALAGCGGGGGSATPPPVADTPPPPPVITKTQLQEAARFASQATFGVPFEALEPMARQGAEDWLTQQFALPVTRHSPTIVEILQRREAGEFDAFEEDIEYLIFARRLAWWHNTITAEDTLRQRVAFALSQIFVVSDNVDILEVYPGALGTYYDLLLTNAFGNFRDLLAAVTRSPAMGIYLSHMNNQRSNPDAGTFPDENYAREVMQLFSIGLFELNADGSRRLDGAGRAIPTYDNSDIGEFAKIFTGFSFGGEGAFFGNNDDPRFSVPMQMFDAAHEPGEKRLLNGFVVPAGQSGDADVEMAIDNLFNHPNVGPFIGRLLIQRLTTSNPSPAYMTRVSNAFADNGNGVRGDMQAVIRAILLDPEARQSAPGDTRGKVSEPVVRYVSLLRQIGVESDDGFIAALGYFLQNETRQHPLSSPSVFNFYLPDHQPAGALAQRDLFAPELSITNANTVIAWPNFLDAVLLGSFVTDPPQGFSEVRLTPDRWLAIADDPAALVDEINTLMVFGRLYPETVDAIIESITPYEEAPLRVALAIYYVAISPEVVVQQ